MQLRTRIKILGILFLVPFFITSCLADILNDTFDLKAPCTLRYDTDYGNAPSAKTFVGSYTLTEEDLPEFEKTTYYDYLYGESEVEFQGWYFDNYGEKKATAGTTISENTTLHAYWLNTRYKSYYIRLYDENINLYDTITIQGGNYLYLDELPRYSKSGYYFAGWYYDPDYTKQAYSQYIYQDYDLYMCFLPEPNNYSLNFYSPNGTLVYSLTLPEGTYLGEYESEITDKINAFLSEYSTPGYDVSYECSDLSSLDTYIYRNYDLYFTLTPKDGIPYKIEYYFMKTQEGSYEFIRDDSLTLNLVGTAGEWIDTWEYNYYKDTYSYNRTSDDYLYRYFDYVSEDETSSSCGYLNGDGSSVFKIYYYNALVTTDQFASLESVLPNIDNNYFIKIIQNSPSDNINLWELPDSIQSSAANSSDSYKKKFWINLEWSDCTEIPAGLFQDFPYITNFCLTNSVTKIGEKAFFNCTNLEHLEINSQGHREWYYSENGTDKVYIDNTDDGESNAEFLKTFEGELLADSE